MIEVVKPALLYFYDNTAASYLTKILALYLLGSENIADPPQTAFMESLHFCHRIQPCLTPDSTGNGPESEILRIILHSKRP